jgi:hypothetical protein
VKFGFGNWGGGGEKNEKIQIWFESNKNSGHLNEDLNAFFIV